MKKNEKLAELGRTTLEKLKEAIQRGDRNRALSLANYLFQEGKALHDLYCDWTFANLDWIARNYGEEQIPKVLRFAREILDKGIPPSVFEMSLEERIEMYAEVMRSHRCGRGEMGNIKVWEDTDRYVMECDPCGSGGRMVRGPLDGTGSRVKSPYDLGRTKKPYPWSWSKVGVPYYCIHCCMWQEVIPIEKNGYPATVVDFPGDDYQEPCRFYFYKDPNLIPEKYFERVGFKKDPSRFRI